MKRRLPRRQGVVHGPLTRHDRSDGGGFMGRAVGAVVVLAAIAVLAVAALNFVGDGGGAAASNSPTATAAAPASRSPSPAPTGSATPRPTATPTRSPVPTPSPSPTPFPVEVREGPGFITFGRDYGTDPARILDPSATFATGGRIAWLANLGGPAGTTQLQIVVARYDPLTGSTTATYDRNYSPNSANSAVFLRRFGNINTLIDGPGIYVARYVVAGETRAEGYFRVEDD